MPLDAPVTGPWFATPAMHCRSGADVTFVGGYYNASTGTTTPSTPGENRGEGAWASRDKVQ